MKILVPTDFSEHATRAAVRAVGCAERAGGEILFLHVTSTSQWSFDPPGEENGLETMAEDLEASALQRLRELRAEAVAGRVASEVHVRSGIPHVEIARFARQAAADIVIVGARGHSRVDRFLLGSTSERVVRSVPCPVLLCRARRFVPGVQASAEDPAAIRRVLAAVDFSPCSLQALETAVGFARLHDAELVLLHVLRDADYPMRQVVSHRMWSEIRRRCRTRLEHLQRDHGHDGIRSTVTLVEGIPSAKIADVAATWAADVIVLGSHGASGVGEFLLGSTAERVVRVAPCSVYVHRNRDRAPGRSDVQGPIG